MPHEPGEDYELEIRCAKEIGLLYMAAGDFMNADYERRGRGIQGKHLQRRSYVPGNNTIDRPIVAGHTSSVRDTR
jgi:hypothetical protein